jgi:hypothetical protein
MPGRTSGECPGGWSRPWPCQKTTSTCSTTGWAVFLLYVGNGLSAGMVKTTDPAVTSLCRLAFEAVWALSIPHRVYQPA